MQAYTTTFAARNGTGTQTISGIVDASGHAFVGKVFLFHGNSTLNTLETAYRRTVGFDAIGTRASVGIEEVSSFGIKLLCYGESGIDSVFSEHSQVFFGGAIYRTAYIQSVASGSFTLNYTLNLLTGDSYSVTVLGGSDLSVILSDVFSGSDFVAGFEPAAAIFSPRETAIGDGATTGSVGGIGYGWAVSDGTQACSQSYVVDQAGNTSYQRTTKANAVIDGTHVTKETAVTAWSATGFAVDVVPTKAGIVALGGIRAASGTITQPADATQQGITIGFYPHIVLFSSVGTAASSSIQTGGTAWTFGMMDGTRQNVYWCGENSTAPPLNGARYLSNAHTLVFGTPAGSGTTFTATANAGGVSDTGFSLNWSAVDGVSRQINWLALGDTSTPPTPSGTTYPVRRLLRFAPPWSAENHLLFISRVEIIMQPGIGTATIPDPVVMIRLSPDGGLTYGPLRTMAVGQSGEYQKRVFLTRWKACRNPVFEVTCSDEVNWEMVSFTADMEEGSS